MTLAWQIPLLAKGFELEQPMNLLGRGLRLQGLQQQNQLAEYDLNDKRATDEERSRMSTNMLSNPESRLDTPEDQRRFVAQYPRLGQKFLNDWLEGQSRRASIDHTTTQTDSAKAKQKQDSFLFSLQKLGGLKDSSEAGEWLTQQVRDGHLSMQQAQQQLAVLRDPAAFQDWRLRWLNMGQKHAEQVGWLTPKLQMVNRGGSHDLVDLNPNTRGSAPTSYATTMDPAEQFRLAEQRRHNVETEGQGRVPAGYRAAPGGLEAIPGGPADPSVKTTLAASKPLPPQVLKMQQEELDAIGLAGSINADLAVISKQLSEGSLRLGVGANFMSRAKNTAGNSDTNSRNFASFVATLEKLRNDSLRLNKGVQTEGDAQRAWDELVKNINDGNLVRQRLTEIYRINERAASLRRMNIDTLRGNYGLPPIDTSQQINQQPALGGAPDSGGVPSDIDAILRKYGGR